LMKNHHTSPFESMTFTFEVKAPIFVLRQWHRHRTWSYNEISARYAQLPNDMYVPDVDSIGIQSVDNKQMRDMVDFSEMTEHQKAHTLEMVELIEEHNDEAYMRYERLIHGGVPRELARGVLPFNTYSHMFATVNLHNLFHFLRLRMHEHSQHEIRVYAEAMLKLIEPIVPGSTKAFKEHVLGE